MVILDVPIDSNFGSAAAKGLAAVLCRTEPSTDSIPLRMATTDRLLGCLKILLLVTVLDVDVGGGTSQCGAGLDACIECLLDPSR